MLIVQSKLQAVDHPYLVAFSKTAVLHEECKKEGNDAMESQCGICDDLAKDVVVSGLPLKTYLCTCCFSLVISRIFTHLTFLSRSPLVIMYSARLVCWTTLQLWGMFHVQHVQYPLLLTLQPKTRGKRFLQI